ncbi:MAG: hypothetical protein LBK12_08600 [Odoribacteraceae bacterium]|nr:hypothetical protein [Odoribacteraceae bacterium]
MALSGEEFYCKTCTVDAVDATARTIDCSPLDDSAPLLGVNLQANQGGEEGVVAFPAPGSHVVVAFITPAIAVVVLSEKIDKIGMKIGDTTATLVDGQVDIATGGTTVNITPDGMTINGGTLGGLVRIEALTSKINDLIEAFNAHTHELLPGAVAVTGSPTAQSNPAPVMVPAITSQHPAVSVSDYEDEHVKH